jgi:hypothetical protein
LPLRFTLHLSGASCAHAVLAALIPSIPLFSFQGIPWQISGSLLLLLDHTVDWPTTEAPIVNAPAVFAHRAAVGGLAYQVPRNLGLGIDGIRVDAEIPRSEHALQFQAVRLVAPGKWNDPDMLVVGHVGWGDPRPSRLTPDEQYSHISLWGLLTAPLLLGTPAH